MILIIDLRFLRHDRFPQTSRAGLKIKPKGRWRSAHHRPAALCLRFRARILQDSCLRLIVAALVIAATTVSAQARTVRILVANLVLLPAVTVAKVGDTVKWINDDMVVHTATARTG